MRPFWRLPSAHRVEGAVPWLQTHHDPRTPRQRPDRGSWRTPAREAVGFRDSGHCSWWKLLRRAQQFSWFAWGFSLSKNPIVIGFGCQKINVFWTERESMQMSLFARWLVRFFSYLFWTLSLFRAGSGAGLFRFKESVPCLIDADDVQAAFTRLTT